MKGLTVAFCLVVAVSAAQADSFDCRRVGWRSTSGRVWADAALGNYAYVVDEAFGQRVTDVGELQSPAEGRNVDAQNTAWRPGAGDYLAEAGGALVGGVLVSAGAGLGLGLAGAALGYLLYPGSYDPLEGPGAWGFFYGGAIGLALGYPAGCAMGAVTVGRWRECEGNTGGAYAGAYVGCLLPLPLIGSPVGAVIGYNIGAHRSGPKNTLGARLAPPTLAYSTRLGPDRQRRSVFDCRLVTVRF